LEVAQEKRMLESGVEVKEGLLRGFLGEFGRKFYKTSEARSKIVLERKGEKVEEMVKSRDGEVEVVPFRAGEETWSLRWA